MHVQPGYEQSQPANIPSGRLLSVCVVVFRGETTDHSSHKSHSADQARSQVREFMWSSRMDGRRLSCTFTPLPKRSHPTLLIRHCNHCLRRRQESKDVCPNLRILTGFPSVDEGEFAIVYKSLVLDLNDSPSHCS